MYFVIKLNGLYYEDMVIYSMFKLFNLCKDLLEYYDGVIGFY